MGDFQFQDIVIYHYILSDKALLSATKPEYFNNSVIRDMFTLCKDHVESYSTAPTKEDLKNITISKCITDKITNDLIDTVYDFDMSSCSPEWLRDSASTWVKVRNMEHAIRKASALMKTSNLDISNAQMVIDNIRNMFINGTSIDLKSVRGKDFFDPESHTQSEIIKHSTGYEYMDNVLAGGFYLGGLFVYLSGPKCGKSFWLINLASTSVLLGNHTAYISLELAVGSVNKRVSANLMDVTMREYSNIVKDPVELKSRLAAIKTNSPHPVGSFILERFPTSTLTVQGLADFLLKEEAERGIKFKNIFIDYINIMCNSKNPNSENTYLKIKTIAEDLRAMAMVNNWCIITVTQTNREGWDSTDLNVKDIAESGGLLHTVDALFGIVTNPDMKSRGVYYLKSLAIRDGELENTRKQFLMNWSKGRITEDMMSPVEDCTGNSKLNEHIKDKQNMVKSLDSKKPLVNTTCTQQPALEYEYKNNTKFLKTATTGNEFKVESTIKPEFVQLLQENLVKGRMFMVKHQKKKSNVALIKFIKLSDNDKN
ncbi:MAG: DnaB-like helicase C-terminal domain-containing protein, partial [Bacteroidales bacterium]